ncbi:hypothetical protein ACIBG7_35550 [Nonomuraea sp. NPDC050328]|uniref:hypothetical protein n=1 Tax=Nonomuraea sp. NPDC050328 TaxID=3364361 RepID=UPI0037946319
MTPSDGSDLETGEGEARLLRGAARELAEVGVAIHEAAAEATRALASTTRGTARAPVRSWRAQRALLRALTSRRGLGFAITGGGLGAVTARLGGLLGGESLAVLVLATSLRLRITAVARLHPELADDPLLRRLIDAVAADRDLASLRAMRALVKDRGAVRALSDLAPVFGEVLALKALLDENPLNDRAAWLIATGQGYATADPITGISNRLVAALDRGRGAARRTAPRAGERFNEHGSLLAFLTNIATIGTTGRVLIQAVTGPDGVTRHVVQAPGMRLGRVDNDSPQDLLGAFSSSVLASSPYSRAVAKAVHDLGLPEGAELALIGHSTGGSAIMNLVQDPAFCARYRVTHAVAVGSPIDFKRPADPRTWIASVTNQHDIIPTLDGQGSGTCFELHPDWYVVDYRDPSHLFPICHSIGRYLANLTDDLPEARARIDAALTLYRGPVTESRLYRLYDDPPAPPGHPFLTVPTYRRHGLDLPITCSRGSSVTAYFAADPAVAAELLATRGLGPAVRLGWRGLGPAVRLSWRGLGSGVRLGSPASAGARAVVSLCFSDHHDSSAGPYRELTAGLLVHDPWRPRRWGVWFDLLRPPGRRRSGTCLLGGLTSSPELAAAAPDLWGYEPHAFPLRTETGPVVLRGPLGPGLPVPAHDHVLYGYRHGTVLRSTIQVRGRTRLHPAPRVRLAVAATGHPLARLLTDLGLHGARPLLCLSTPAHQTLRSAGAPVPIT